MRRTSRLLTPIAHRHTVIPQFIPISLYLFFLNLSAGNLGSFPAALANFFSLAALTSLFIFYAPIHLLGRNLRENVQTLYLISVALLLFLQNDIFQIFAAALLIWMLGQHLANQKRNVAALADCCRITICYAIFMMVCEYFPVAVNVSEHIARFFSSTASHVSGQNLNYGPTYMGLNVSVSFLFACSVIGCRKNAKWLYGAIGLLSYMALATLWHMIFHNWLISTKGYSDPLVSLFLINSNILLFVLLLPCIYFTLKPDRATEFSCAGANWLTYLGSTVLLVLAWWPAWIPSHHPVNGSKKIVFNDQGQLDWHSPVFGQYGGKNGGMFGTVIKHLNAAGYEVQIDRIRKDALADAAVLVLINSSRRFTAQEKRLVWDFVNNGGGLLVLGDHTGREVIRDPFNDLLAPVKIEFNFDSAMPMTPKWANAHAIKPHYITQTIRDENDLQIWIGASLTVSYPARPLVIGKYAYADQGNMLAENLGYLGDMRYLPGERLGDITLVATSHFGDGRVLVFGDTSSIQNSALFLSLCFVQRIFGWLTAERFVFYPYDRFFTSLACVFLMINFSFKHQRILRAAMMATMICFAIAVVGSIAQHSHDHHKPPPRLPTALIDASHLGLFNLDAWGAPNGFGGLAYNLERNGYLPVVMRKFNRDDILNSELLVIMAPAKQYTGAEIRILDDFVANGGHLIIAVGWEERKTCQALLGHFQLGVENIPLGRIQPIQTSRRISLSNAWPIHYEDNDTEVLATVWDHPVAIIQRHGNGRIFMVGDASFFHNKNLEGLNDFSIENIQFLRDTFRDKLAPTRK